jgi:hypothetical protein
MRRINGLIYGALISTPLSRLMLSLLGNLQLQPLFSDFGNHAAGET